MFPLPPLTDEQRTVVERVAALSRDDLNDIYLGKKTEWDGGILIQPVDQQRSAGRA